MRRPCAWPVPPRTPPPGLSEPIGDAVPGYCRTAYRGGSLMRSVTYSMGVSLDGYIVGPDGRFDWTAPDPEVFQLAIDEIRQIGVHLMGRRLYETMLYWETADQDP